VGPPQHLPLRTAPSFGNALNLGPYPIHKSDQNPVFQTEIVFEIVESAILDLNVMEWSRPACPGVASHVSIVKAVELSLHCHSIERPVS
jgi:hypothetical protein